jgi:hypothetical protein
MAAAFAVALSCFLQTGFCHLSEEVFPLQHCHTGHASRRGSVSGHPSILRALVHGSCDH